MRPMVAVAILALAPLTAALADVYRSVDAQGHVLYSDTPSPGAQLVRVTSSSPRFAAQFSTPASTPRAAAPPPPKSTDTLRDQLAREEASRAVQSDVAQTRADQCKKAQEHYQETVQARRIYSQEVNGERQYLSDADAEQARVNAKLAMDDACKGQ
jgi:hypothetical protein